MAKTEKALTPETLAREIETLAKRYSDSDNKTIQEAVEILTAVRKPLFLGAAYFTLVVEFFAGLEEFITNRLSK
jgi:hypothetical protein